MGSTPTYNLPWPELGNDADGPGAFKNLAEATETALSGFTPPVPEGPKAVGLFKNSSPQAITSRVPSTAWTLVTWPSTYIDTSGGDLTVSANEIVNSSGGDLLVSCTAAICFDAHASGARWMSFRKTVSGTPAYFASDTKQTGNTGLVVVRSLMDVFVLEDGASLGIVCAQNSGGNLDIRSSLTSSGGPTNIFQVRILGDAP